MPGHLIHIGFPKAGSTALGAWFDAHPQLEYAPNAIAGCHDAFGIAARAAARETAGWYVTSSESLSMPRMTDDPRLRAPGAPGRRVPLPEARERVCRNLALLFADATILIVTRGFRGQVLSGYSQYVKSGGTLPLPALFSPEGRDEDEADGWLDYDAVVALYEDVFGPENAIVLPYELLRDEPGRFLAVLEERMGLEPGAAPPPARNRSLSPAGMYWHRRASALVLAARRPLPRRLGDRLLAEYVRRARADRLLGPVEVLERVLPGTRSSDLDVPREMLDFLRGRASGLAGRPFFDRYAAEYLNEPAAGARGS